jgi:hypothetical protein
VHGTFGTELLEKCVWRPVDPVLALADENVFELALGRRHLDLLRRGSGA